MMHWSRFLSRIDWYDESDTANLEHHLVPRDLSWRSHDLHVGREFVHVPAGVLFDVVGSVDLQLTVWVD